MAEYNPSKIIKDGNTYNFRDTTKIPLAGSNQISGSLIPSTDGTVNLGSPSYQWNNLYAKNYYYNGTAWGLNEANQWGANNKFTGNVSITKSSDSPTALSDTSLALTGTSQYIFFRTKGSSNYKSYNSFLWGGYLSGASPYRFGRIRLYRASAVYGETGEETPDTSFSFIDVALHYKWVSLTDNVKFINDQTTNACAPLTNNATDLGTSTNKWKSINGINPGALSLPSDTYIDIDTTNYAWGSNFTFTPDYDGYCFINIGASGNSRKFSLKTGRGEYYFSNQTDIFRFTFPVYKGKLVTILTSSSGTESVIPTIRLFPCQGNV